MNAVEYLRAKVERDFLGPWEMLPRFRDLPTDQYEAYGRAQERNLRRAQLGAMIAKHEAEMAKQRLFEHHAERARERDGW